MAGMERANALTREYLIRMRARITRSERMSRFRAQSQVIQLPTEASLHDSTSIAGSSVDQEKDPQK